MSKSTIKSFKSKVIDHDRLQDLFAVVYDANKELEGIVRRLLEKNGLDYKEIYGQSIDIGFEIIEKNQRFTPNIPKFSSNDELQDVIESFFFQVCCSKVGDDKNLISYNPYCFEIMMQIQSLQGYSEDDIGYYNIEYRKKRLEVFLRDGEVCAKCGAIPKPGVSLTIDHIKPTSKHPELFLDINNLQVLCWPCNQGKSNKHETDYR